MEVQQEMIHTFPNGNLLSFKNYNNFEYFPILKKKDTVYQIPILLNLHQIFLAMEKIEDIKWFNSSFELFCQIITGYLLIIVKYRSQIESGSLLKKQI